MRSNFHNVQVIVSFLLLISACQTGATTDVVTTDVAATATNAEEETTGCKQIIFSYSTYGRISESNIVSICPDGSDMHRLTSDSYHDLDPAWSPDGSKIAFFSNRSGTMQLHMMDPDGSNMRQITFDLDVVEWDWFWLPDGNRIAALLITVDGEISWNVINVLTNEMSPLAEWSNDFFFQYPLPAFSHDGTHLAYLTHSGQAMGNYRPTTIHIQNVDGSNAYTLISDIWTGYEPTWSPDDSQIAFLLDLTGTNEQFAIYTANLDGSNLQAVTGPVFSTPIFISWSPDGESFLIFYNETLSVLDIKSGDTIKLFTVSPPGYLSGVSWQP